MGHRNGRVKRVSRLLLVRLERTNQINGKASSYRLRMGASRPRPRPSSSSAADERGTQTTDWENEELLRPALELSRFAVSLITMGNAKLFQVNYYVGRMLAEAGELLVGESDLRFVPTGVIEKIMGSKGIVIPFSEIIAYEYTGGLARTVRVQTSQ